MKKYETGAHASASSRFVTLKHQVDSDRCEHCTRRQHQSVHHFPHFRSLPILQDLLPSASLDYMPASCAACMGNISLQVLSFRMG
ncbi:MAG: hypothetical protein J6N19_00230 [Clostridium sp.]|nr:hypothetical protein [Clostridium sp.]